MRIRRREHSATANLLEAKFIGTDDNATANLGNKVFGVDITMRPATALVLRTLTSNSSHHEEQEMSDYVPPDPSIAEKAYRNDRESHQQFEHLEHAPAERLKEDRPRLW